MHFPGRISIKRGNGSLTVEAAMLMPLIVIVTIVFLGLLRFLAGYQMLSSAIYDCADCMADYGDLYEILGLGNIHRAVTGGMAEDGDNAEQAVDSLSEELKIPDEGIQVIEPIIKEIIKVLQPEKIKQALEKKVYFYLVDQAGQQLTKILMQNRLKGSDLAAVGIKNGLDGLSFRGSRFLYQEGEHGALIQLMVSYQPELFPGSSWLGLDPVEISVTVHAFLGRNPFQSALKTQKMYYQIGQGKRYHDLDCYLINKDIVCITLQEAQRQGYGSCQRCRSWETGKVWITSGGERYHQKTCSYLYPDLQELTKKEAEEKGLTPCELCQGSGGGFG